ncbi:MAG TPA: hypothetical protein VGF67_22295 [Ktedonobacteraceae bacterium]|jgi:hypothetical protein
MTHTDNVPVADLTQEAARILTAAEVDNIPLRLLGGVAIYLQCPSVRSDARFQRVYKDIDFITLGRWGGKTRTLFTRLGYTPNQAFNALHGYQRLLFWDTLNQRQVDIFIDRMQMCHTLDFRARLRMHPRTLSPTDLLLTKLQIVEVNEKDLLDTMALFQDYDVCTDDAGLNGVYLAQLAAGDWGLYKTLITNLQKAHTFAHDRCLPRHIPARISTLCQAIEAQPRSLAWKARAIVGERVRWYELPEEPR